MSEGKRKFIEDAALVIDGRVADLKAEIERIELHHPNVDISAADRAAILEAEHCARMIRTLAKAPYRDDPYKVAKERWAKGA